MRILRLLLAVLSVLTSVVSVNTAPVLANHQPFQEGDLFIGIAPPSGGASKIEHRSPNATFIEDLYANVAGDMSGMAFDQVGNLYVTTYGSNYIVKFDSSGNILKQIRTTHVPASIVFGADGSYYVGHLRDGRLDEYDSGDNLVSTFTLSRDITGSAIRHIDIASDQCTLFYASGSSNIKRFDVCTGQQLPNFATVPDNEARAMRLLFDGGLLVAGSNRIYRLDYYGTIIQAYAVAGGNTWSALALVPDGRSFWIGSAATSRVYNISIESGNQLASFATSNGMWVESLAIFSKACAFSQDCDLDGLSNADEATMTHTDPYKKDTDGDGLLDPWEVDPDPDGNGTPIPGAGFNTDADPEIEVQRDVVFGPYADDPRSQGLEELPDGRHQPSFPKFITPPDPLHKDIYFELDWQDCLAGGCPDFVGTGIDPTHHAPSGPGMAKVQETFATAPVTNPDGSTGINFHVLIDERVTHSPNCDQGQSSVRDSYFGTPEQRQNDTSAGDILRAKASAFRYIWSGHSTERDDTGTCANPWFFDLMSEQPLPFYDYSPFGDAHIGGSDILVSLGPLWICPSYNVILGDPTCFRDRGLFGKGIFPASVYTDENKGGTRRFDWPLHSVVMHDGDTEKAAIARLWSRTLMHLIGHSLGIASDQDVRNDPRIYSADGQLIGTEPELYASWSNLKYAPPPDDQGSDAPKEAYPPQGVVQPPRDPAYPGPDVGSTSSTEPFYYDLDIDRDGVIDGIDNCLMGIRNADQADLDGDGRGDACDYDIDQDGQLNAVGANTPAAPDAFPYDTDNDGADNPISSDDDGDSVEDSLDNCPLAADSSRLDTDLDTMGDVCDNDDDNDSFIDRLESETGSNSVSSASTPEYIGQGVRCTDGIDNDRDSLIDSADAGCIDTDNDTRADSADNCPDLANYGWRDQDNDGIGDACDSTPLPPNTAPTASIADSYTLDEGSSVEVSATGSDTEAGALAYVWDLNNDGTFGSLGQRTVLSASDLKLDGPGTYPIAVKVVDEGGLSATATTTATVRNRPPVVGRISTSTNPVMATSLLMTSASFADPGLRDTHTAVWDWGDGTTSAGAIKEIDGAGTAKGSHVYTNPGTYTVKLTVTDDEQASSQVMLQNVVVSPAPHVRFSAVDYRVQETIGNATVTVTLDAAASDPVTVKYATSPGTALVGSDYTTAEGVLTFAPGETARTFAVWIENDTADETDETINLTLSDPFHASLGSPGTATITIVDEDIMPGVAFDLSKISVQENVGAATVKVELTTASNNPVTVEYATSDGTATAGSDYTATSGTLTFTPGETSKTFAVPILDDIQGEANETVTLTLSNPANATLGAPATATLTINTNDTLTFSGLFSVDESGGAETITVRLNAASNVPVTVEYATSDGTAMTGSDYTATSGTITFTPGETSKTFVVPILDDIQGEANETVTLTLSNPANATLGTPSTATLTIKANDTLTFGGNVSVQESAGSATMTVRLNAASNVPVTVGYATSNGTAIAGSDYTATSGTLTFNPGETSKTFAVPILDDIQGEANETVTLTLSNPSNATLGAPSTATLTINANDTLTFGGNVSVQESAGSGTMTVKLSGPSSIPVTVEYATSNGTAIAGSDYTATSGTLTFTPGETSKTFVVPILDDIQGEANETVTLTLSNPSNATLGAPSSATLTISANDTLSFSGVFSIHENGGAETITVKLSGPSSVPVTVEYATGNGTAIAGSDYTATSGTLTFTPGETSKTFAVPILDDIQGEANETVTLTLSNPSNATLGAPSSATLTINANDTLTFSASSYRVNESSSAATITVKLSGPSSIPVTVEYATSNGTATAGSDYTATSGILTFNPGETSKTFAVPFINDTVDEPDETVTISLGNPGNAVLGSPATTTLTIVDND